MARAQPPAPPAPETAPAEKSGAAVDFLTVEYLTLSELRSMVHAANPKRHDVARIAGSMLRWGFTIPLVIDARSNVMAAGHGRLDAAGMLFTQGAPPQYEGAWPPKNILVRGDEWMLPVIRHLFTSDEERDAYVIADNRLTEMGGWDRERLRELVSKLGSQRLTDIYTREEYERVVGNFKPAIVEEVDVSTLRASFFFVVRGPVSAQPEVLRLLREHLEKLPGVTVEGRVDAF